jgi:ribosomal protein S18 acetylase RimI-like enzyme
MIPADGWSSFSRVAKDLNIRPFRPADLDGAAAVSAAAFGVDLSDARVNRRWRQRVGYLLKTDPDGAFVAERAEEIVGVAEAMRRERLWCLSLLAVRPGLQSRGAGRKLIDRALSYAGESDAGLIVSSNDPRALRLYALSGFSLLPTFQTEGTVDRRKLPRPDPGVSDAGAADIEAFDAIGREVRGAPYAGELEFVLEQGAHLLRFGDRGFAVVQPGQSVWLLAARDDDAACALMWSALAIASGNGDRPVVKWLTADQDWAIRICMRAGLSMSANGALCVRGNPGALRPFVPSGPFA